MDKYRARRNLLIAILIILLLAIIALSIYNILKNTRRAKEEILYAGIGGAVNDTGVYRITDDTRLFELIRLAEGLHKRADISNVDTDQKAIPWEVYCIPFLPQKKYEQEPEIVYDDSHYNEPLNFKEPEKINIVYAGLPRTYLLISIIAEKNLITVTHIPWYTMATSYSEYARTLYEIYLTGGVPFLISGVTRITNLKIDYFFTQKRPSWINFIDYLGGIEVNIPEEFAKEYNLSPSLKKLDGLLSWEYISYISKKQRNAGQWLSGSMNRMEMQKEFMQGMYDKFKTNNFFIQGDLLVKMVEEAETNMKAEDLIMLTKIYKKMDNPELKLLTLPGSLQEFDNRIMWVTNLNEYRQKQNEIYYQIIKEMDQIRIDKGGFGGEKDEN